MPARRLVVLVLMGMIPSAAYCQVARKPVVVHVAGGYAAALGDAADFFHDGYDGSGGVTFHFKPTVPVGLRLDAGYGRFGAVKHPTESSTNEGYLSMTRLTVDAIWDFGGTNRVGGYVAGGIGGYSRYRRLTQTILVGSVQCDPIFGGCVSTVQGSVIEDNESDTVLGYNVSAAITFPVRSGGQIYFEGTYHRAGSGPATEYWPITIGYRW